MQDTCLIRLLLCLLQSAACSGDAHHAAAARFDCAILPNVGAAMEQLQAYTGWFLSMNRIFLEHGVLADMTNPQRSRSETLAALPAALFGKEACKMPLCCLGWHKLKQGPAVVGAVCLATSSGSAFVRGNAKVSAAGPTLARSSQQRPHEKGCHTDGLHHLRRVAVLRWSCR